MESIDGLVTTLPPHLRDRILRAAQSHAHETLSNGNTSICIPSSAHSTAVSVHDDVIDRHSIEVQLDLHNCTCVCAPPSQAAHTEAHALLDDHGETAKMGGQATGGTWADPAVRARSKLQHPAAHKTASQARGDTRVWLTPSLLTHDGHPTLRALAASIVHHLPTALRAQGLLLHPGHLSMQLARYPGRGEGYVTHRDRSHAAPTRVWSVILYLNLDWNEDHGGCLRVFHCTTVRLSRPQGVGCAKQVRTKQDVPRASTASTLVPPLPGRLVCFPAHLPHKVEPCWAPRLALTAWVCTPEAPDPPRGLNAAPPWTIFVSVVAYRDAETRWTLCDLFKRAAHPAALRVGVVWQLRLPEDAPLQVLPEGLERAVRQVVLGAHEATGPCAARAMATFLYRNETFVLQVDAHCRFAPGWDVALVDMLLQAEQGSANAKAVLSTYPAAYQGSGAQAVCDGNTAPVALVASHFDSDGMLRCRGRRLAVPRLPAPLPAVWWAAGLSFSRGLLLKEVPYVSNVPWLFFGEETLMLLRMWQAGWDVYCPTHTVVFHQWSRSGRPTPSTDGIMDPVARAASQKHVRALLAGRAQHVNVEVVPTRTLAAFYEHTGVDFALLCIHERGRTGGLPPTVAFAAADVESYG